MSAKEKCSLVAGISTKCPLRRGVVCAGTSTECPYVAGTLTVSTVSINRVH